MKNCNTCCWHGLCAMEFYHGGCDGVYWKPDEETVHSEAGLQRDINTIISDCADFCHFADELHKLVVKSHKVDDVLNTKDKCLAYAAQLWFHNKGKLIKGDK